jgi:hypothetical protein
MKPTQRLQCACGSLQLEVEGAPIITAECQCESCRIAAAKIRTLPSVPTFMEPNGGTRLVLYRKDRVRFVEGAELLRGFHLTPKTKTRRVVASCCNTPVFLEILNGHWLSLFACLWPSDTRPAAELRTMMSDLPAGTTFPDDVPSYSRQSVSFFAKLLGAWIAMGFRIPKIAVAGELDV